MEQNAARRVISVSYLSGRIPPEKLMSESVSMTQPTPATCELPTFLPRKGVLRREYHVLAVLPDGRRIKIGQFPRKPDAARWIAHKSADWLAQHYDPEHSN